MAGTGVVILTTELTGPGCKSADSFAVNVGSGISPLPQVVFYGGNELICTDNTAESYQWGYDNSATLDSAIITGAVNQDYYIDSPDFANKFYWVITTHGDCLQKSYYTTPTAVSNVAKIKPEILLFPNPADNKINIVLKGISISTTVDVKLLDMGGNDIYKTSIISNAGSVNLTQLPPGVYLLMFSENGVILGSKTFVKN